MEALKRDPKFAQQKADNVLYCPREEHLSLRPQFENTQVQYARPLGDHSRLPALTKTQSTFSDRSKRYTQEQSDFIVYLAHEMKLPYWYLIPGDLLGAPRGGAPVWAGQARARKGETPARR